MARRWGVAFVSAAVAVGCVPEGTGVAPNPWDPVEHSAALGVAQNDPWCVHMRDLRRHLDGAGPPPGPQSRAAALAAVRAEADADKGGDPFWPFRKALVCEYLDAAAEERAEFDWSTTAQFLETARLAVEAQAPADGVSPLVPVYDHLDGEAPESLTPVDLTTNGYCQSLDASELALSQQRGPVVQAVSFPGSLRRAPDWFAHVQVAYHRWAREHREGVLFVETGPGAAVDFGGVPTHCGRFHAALEGSKAFAIKDNLIFLLPERDDPTSAGRLEVTDVEGNRIVLDEVLAAAQLDAGGQGGERVDFFPSDLAASPVLSGAVERANDLPPPQVFRLFFEEDSDTLTAADPGYAELTAELKSRSPEEPIRVVLSGHADCVGPAGYNQALSDRRVRVVFEEVIRPALTERGFDEADFADRGRFQLVALGERVPASPPERPGCAPEDEDRRVVVVVQ